MINEIKIESMVGLSVVLQDGKAAQSSSSNINNNNVSFSKLQVMIVNKKATVVVNDINTLLLSPSSARTDSVPAQLPRLYLPRHNYRPPVFLDACFLCKAKLLPGKDIYMYKGDRGFCSVECRCRQILLDEQAAEAAARSSDDHCSLRKTSRRRIDSQRLR